MSQHSACQGPPTPTPRCLPQGGVRICLVGMHWTGGFGGDLFPSLVSHSSSKLFSAMFVPAEWFNMHVACGVHCKLFLAQMFGPSEWLNKRNVTWFLWELAVAISTLTFPVEHACGMWCPLQCNMAVAQNPATICHLVEDRHGQATMTHPSP